MKYHFFIAGILFISQLSFAQSVKKPVSQTQKEETTRLKEIRSGGFRYINPLLDCYDLKSTGQKTIKIIKSKVEAYILNATMEKRATSVSFYYRDLNNGPWIGVNEDETYAPASLLKVPYLIAALKQAESDPYFLSRKVQFNFPNSYYTQNILDTFSLKQGSYYSIDELISAMIIYSDNNAKDLVVQNLTDENYKNVFNDLGIDINKYDRFDAPTDFMSAREYASFYRILYNATYLNKEMSEKALGLLLKTVFAEGLLSGIPKDIEVSNKFGERTFAYSNIKELHDCGIVYMPKNPYLICIMTKGIDFYNMKKVISDISKIVYTELNKQENTSNK